MIRRIGCKVINGGYAEMDEMLQYSGFWWIKSFDNYLFYCTFVECTLA